MRPLHCTAALALVALPVAAGLGLAAGTARASDRDDPVADARRVRPPQTIEITAAIATFDFVDVNAPGITAGDYFVQTNTLTVDGQSQGTDLLRCTASGDMEHPGICDIVMTLEGGTITAAGELPKFEPIDGLPFALAITGGTGAYAGAAGEASVIERAGGYEATLVVTRQR